jgi:hypothetical protein
MSITGSGPVHGALMYLSSSRGELQGITALTVITKFFLEFFNTTCKATFICDNSGVIKTETSFSSLKSQRDTNVDLYLTHRSFRRGFDINLEWVRSHSDSKPWTSIKVLQEQQLSRDQIYNVWCDRMAEKAQENTLPAFLDSDVTIAEKWAVYARFPHLHKLSGNLDMGYYSTIGYSDLANYLQSKHQLSEAKLQNINLLPLHSHLSSLQPHPRANVAKLMHRWIPTNSSLSCQGRVPSPLCPCCSESLETWDHVFSCLSTPATTVRRSALQTFLSKLANIGTPIHILVTFEYKLSITLGLPYTQTFHMSSPICPSLKCLLIDAIHHQNIVGWDKFLSGYTSSYWETLTRQTHKMEDPPTPHVCWANKLVQYIFHLTSSICTDRNTVIHGASRLESQRLLRMRVQEQVRQIYKHPPKFRDSSQ